MSRHDRLDQLVSRGFDCIESGDIAGAETALGRAQRIDRRHYDVIDLEAAVASAVGEVDRSIELYQKLVELEPNEPSAWINTAAVELHGRADPEAALVAVDKALDLVDDDVALTDAVMIKADALLALDRKDEARTALAELATSIVDDTLALQLAELWFDAGDGKRAIALAKQAAAVPEQAASAYHLIGLVHDEQRNLAARTEAWLTTRRMDLEAPRQAWSLSHDDFDQLAHEALKELPERAQELLGNTPILVEDVPSEELVADGVDPRLLGLFQGRPYPDHGNVGGGPELTTIHLFQKNLEATALDVDDLAEQIRITVLHETAHFFGLEEEDLEAMGLD